MGWFGMPNMNKEQAFNELFSQSQYIQKFELLWQKHSGNRSYAVFTLDDRYFGEIIIWNEDDDELMYKPITWIDEVSKIPKKYHKELYKNLSEYEKEIYLAEIDKINERKKYYV